jgi:hypothetical protein
MVTAGLELGTSRTMPLALSNEGRDAPVVSRDSTGHQVERRIRHLAPFNPAIASKRSGCERRVAAFRSKAKHLENYAYLLHIVGVTLNRSERDACTDLRLKAVVDLAIHFH